MSDKWRMDEDGEVHPFSGSIEEWASVRRNNRVDLTEQDGVKVSTVFLDFDHGYGDGPPVLFETMVFGGDMDGEQERYQTRAEAADGHRLMCARVWPNKEQNP